MATPLVNTLALVPPRRPTADDLGGLGKKNHATFTPNPVTMPTAEDWLEIVRMLVAAWSTAPVGVIPVTFIAGAPIVGTPSCGNPAIVAATITPTDNGAGDTTLTWPANTFPNAICNPAVILNVTTGNWCMPRVIVGSNSVQVQTPNNAGTLADANFTLFVF